MKRTFRARREGGRRACVAQADVSASLPNPPALRPARNPVGVATLDTPYADPASEELRVAYNLLFTTLFRPPT